MAETALRTKAPAWQDLDAGDAWLAGKIKATKIRKWLYDARL